jgi:hypothetical protein
MKELNEDLVRRVRDITEELQNKVEAMKSPPASKLKRSA